MRRPDRRYLDDTFFLDYLCVCVCKKKSHDIFETRDTPPVSPTLFPNGTRFESQKFTHARSGIDYSRRSLEVCSFLSLARWMRCYDAARQVLRGPCAFGCGSDRLTARCETEGGLDAVPACYWLPAGLGERAARHEHASEEKRCAEKRVFDQLEAIRAEKARQAFEAELAAQAAMRAQREKTANELRQEERLYRVGARSADAALRFTAAQGPGSASADRKRLAAEEDWELLQELRRERLGEQSVAFAVALNNCAALAGERGKDEDSNMQLEVFASQALCGFFLFLLGSK